MADSIRSSLNLKIRDPFKARIAPPHSSMVAHPAVTIAQQLYEGGRATGELYGQQPLLSLPEPYCISQCQRSADCRQRAESCKTASHGNTSYREKPLPDEHHARVALPIGALAEGRPLELAIGKFGRRELVTDALLRDSGMHAPPSP